MQEKRKNKIAGIPRILAIPTMYKIMHKRRKKEPGKPLERVRRRLVPCYR